jgi:hypothetical protein
MWKYPPWIRRIAAGSRTSLPMTTKPATLESLCGMLQEALEHLHAIRQMTQECIAISDRIIARLEEMQGRK